MHHQPATSTGCSLFGTVYDANVSAIESLVPLASKRITRLPDLESIASLLLGIRHVTSEPDQGLPGYYKNMQLTADNPFWTSEPVRAALECHARAGSFYGCGAAVLVAAKIVNHQLTDAGEAEVRAIVQSSKGTPSESNNLYRFLKDPAPALTEAQSGLNVFCEVFLEARNRGFTDDATFNAQLFSSALQKESVDVRSHSLFAFDLLKLDHSAVRGILDDLNATLNLYGSLLIARKCSV